MHGYGQAQALQPMASTAMGIGTSPVRMSSVRAGMDELDKLTSILNEAIGELRSRFAPVIYNEPRPTSGELKQCDGPSGCDLGQALRSLAGRLSNSIADIRDITNTADL